MLRHLALSPTRKSRVPTSYAKPDSKMLRISSWFGCRQIEIKKRTVSCMQASTTLFFFLFLLSL